MSKIKEPKMVDFLSLSVVPYGGYIENGEIFNEYGEPARNKWEYPYSYDPILAYQNDAVKVDRGVYSDRLYQWDYKKHDKVSQKVFGNISQTWSDRSPKQIQEFLRFYFEDETIQLALVVEYCSQSSGYPCWYFGYASSKS